MLKMFKHNWFPISWTILVFFVGCLYTIETAPSIPVAIVTIAALLWIVIVVLRVFLDTTSLVFARIPPVNVRENFTADSHRDQEKYWANIHSLASYFGTEPKATEKYVRKVLAGKY